MTGAGEEITGLHCVLWSWSDRSSNKKKKRRRKKKESSLSNRLQRFSKGGVLQQDAIPQTVTATGAPVRGGFDSNTPQTCHGFLPSSHTLPSLHLLLSFNAL